MATIVSFVVGFLDESLVNRYGCLCPQKVRFGMGIKSRDFGKAEPVKYFWRALLSRLYSSKASQGVQLLWELILE